MKAEEPLKTSRTPVLGERLAQRLRFLCALCRGRSAGEILDRVVKLVRRDGFTVTLSRLRSFRVVPRGGPPDWVNYRPEPELSAEACRRELAALRERPQFSLLIPAEEGKSEAFGATLRATVPQTYEEWELLVPGCWNVSPEALHPALRARFRATPAIADFPAALNAAARTAQGAYLVILEPGVELSPDALHHLAVASQRQPAPDAIYSDEDQLDSTGQRVAPLFKPDWSPEYLLSAMYTGSLLAVRRDFFLEIGGFREEIAVERTYDLLLRLAERTDRVHHVARVLYHRRQTGAENSAWLAAARLSLVLEALARRGLGQQVEERLLPGTFHPILEIRSPRRISIIIPTRDQPASLRQAVESVLSKSTYPDYEIIVVNNGSVRPETLDLLEKLRARARVRVLDDARPFNFSALNNRAAREATGDYLLFLNDDVEVITPRWMEEMAGYLEIPAVAAVGAKLYYPNETIQHAGVILGLGGLAGHGHKHFPRAAAGYGGRLLVPHNLSAVTAACLLMRREVFMALGGFEERLAVALNDVDLCLRIRAQGLRIVFTPYAELYHHESLSRGYEDTAEKVKLYYQELAFCKSRWGEEVFNRDPYYHPCLTRESEDFAFDRRVRR